MKNPSFSVFHCSFFVLHSSCTLDPRREENLQSDCDPVTVLKVCRLAIGWFFLDTVDAATFNSSADLLWGYHAP